MTATNKLAIIQTKEWICRINEVWMINYFYFVFRSIEQFSSRDESHDIIVFLIDQTVRHGLRQIFIFPGLNGSAVPQCPVLINKTVEVRKSLVLTHGTFNKK